MIIDTHCHLHDPAFTDIREMLSRALAHDVWGVIGAGCDAATNETTIDAAGSLPKAIWACAGFHPEWTHLGGFDLEQVEAQVRGRHSRLVALGEVGLPWYSLKDQADAMIRIGSVVLVPAGREDCYRRGHWLGFAEDAASAAGDVIRVFVTPHVYKA